jgi:predicted regulator of Ras-like GTPase activity (Roadblock/LC7/MglB family)
VSDDIRTLSEALAADPSSPVFLQLGELLRRGGQLELANRVATRGLERHAGLAATHDLVARVALDLGDFERAKAEWESVLSIAPGHTGAQKGLGFLSFRQGHLDAATRYLSAALAADPHDASLASALDTVRAAAAESARSALDRPTATTASLPGDAMEAPAPPLAPEPADARTLFADLIGEAQQTALLLDGDGYVVAGQYVTADGRDAGADIGAQLSGVSEEASRAMRHLGLGSWRQIVFEAEAASVAMAPSGEGVLLVAASRAVPLGFVRRLLERSLERSRRWLENGT